ncbi:MAG TPA: diguanylate cyclase [Candidatus Bathyarchaeia archaeon]|nr:diguanylate cyclase [Candidatus Bathyarchaeia archaeon]
MPQDPLLLAFVGILILANVALMASIPFQSRLRRRSARQLTPQPRSASGAEPGGVRSPVTQPNEFAPAPVASARPWADDDARAAAAIEAFVAEVSPDAAGRVRPPSPSEVIALRRETMTVGAEEPAAVTIRAADRPAERPASDSRAIPSISVSAERTSGLRWTPPGLADPAMWDRAIREESARMARFGHPVTVVMAELRHIDALADRLGRDAADRVTTETARLLVKQGRASDRLAWLGDAKFGVLLLETEEVRACGYVERVRAAADSWLESAGLSVRLSLGWASPTEGDDVVAAAATAKQRMFDADRSSSSPDRATVVPGA